ncbi:hypothetical protein FQN60_017812 [Etheostoma spectabile]|uniref:Uncharacterized protein n=1 Tax=Etheostoma spectabile TaxID=54343 RepID=A0A5J5DG98_9PERO|nr:hypothetical protein FQN60_017812 [Etheostoma spectabile]
MRGAEQQRCHPLSVSLIPSVQLLLGCSLFLEYNILSCMSSLRFGQRESGGRLQPPPIPHLQPPQQESTSAAGHAPTEPPRPSILSGILLLRSSTAASNASSHVGHSLPSHHASPLYATSHPGSSSDHAAHTRSSSAPAQPSALRLPDRLPASSSTGTPPGESPSACPPAASPRPVELRERTNYQHRTILDCTHECLRAPRATLSGRLVKWSSEDSVFSYLSTVTFVRI